MFGFKRQKIREPSLEELQTIVSNYLQINSFDIEYKDNYTMTELQEMYNFIDINISVESLIRGVTSRELIFTSEDPDEDNEFLLVSQKRFNNIKGKMNFIKELSMTPFLKYTVHEVIYNEDFTIKKMGFIPRELIRYDTLEKKMYLIGKDGEREYIGDNPYKWHVSVYNGRLDSPLGKTLFTPIVKTYEKIKYIEGKINGIVEKYGGSIVVFGYDPKASEEKVKKMGERLKRMTDKNIVAMPNKTGNLKDNMYLIRLSDLNIEIHTQLIKELEKKITQNLLGGTLAVDTEGNSSYALGKVHQEEKEKIEDEIAMFVREELDKLVDIDGAFQGYDPTQYYIEIKRQADREKELQIKNLEQEELNKKANIIKTLSDSGYEVSEEELRETFKYKSIKKKEQTTNINPFFEFSKKNSDDSNKKTVEYIEKLRKKVILRISEKIKKQVKNIKSIDDIKNIDTGTEEHQNALILAELWGQYLTIKDREKMKEYKKRTEFAVYRPEDFTDIFNMPFNEAINWLLDREPVLYDQVQKVIENYRSNYFWIKRSSDLETTKIIYAELLKNLELGQTFEDFKKNLYLDNLGLGEDGYYLRQVFDQTMINAQSMGHWTQLQEGVQYGFVYGLYDAIVDGRETDLCRKLDGKIYKLDSPFWERFYPPNHFRCRSRVIALSEEDIIELGYSIETVNPELEPQKGFGKNIGKTYISQIQIQVKEKEKEAEIIYKKVVGYESQA